MYDLRVGFLTYGLDRPLGGIGRTVRELGRALQAAGCAPVFLTPYRQGLFVGEPGYRAHYLPGCRLLPGLMVAGPLLLAWTARQLSLDILHDPVGVCPFLPSPARSYGTVVNLYDAIAFRYPEGYTRLNNFLHRSYIPHMVQYADQVLVDSDDARNDLLRYLPLQEEKVHMVPIGVEGRFRPQSTTQVAAVRSRYHLPERFILYVGALEPRKNVVGLLRAFALVRRTLPEARLVITGRPTWKHEQIFHTLRALDLEHDVIFTGYVADADLPALYASATVFCFPSLYEGFGLPVLEAMACGTPVVCSNTSSLPEVAGDAALQVDPRNDAAIADALERLLTDSALAADLRERGLARAQGFTWERTAAMTIAVYRQVLDQKGHAR